MVSTGMGSITPPLLLTDCVTLEKSINTSVPQLPCLQSGGSYIFLIWFCELYELPGESKSWHIVSVIPRG